jgi:protein SCO1
MAAPRRAWPALFFALAGAGASLALGAGCDRDRSTARDPAALEVYGELPPFSFTDHRDQPLSDGDLRGHVTVASFLFTRCPTVCPVVVLKLRRVEEETRDLGDRLRIVSFSVDPEHDTPEVLAGFAAAQRADSPRWSFVTGPTEEMRARVEDSLKIAIDHQGTLEDGVPDIVHGTHFVLLDAELRIRGYYDSGDAERLADLAADARALATELRP